MIPSKENLTPHFDYLFKELNNMDFTSSYNLTQLFKSDIDFIYVTNNKKEMLTYNNDSRLVWVTDYKSNEIKKETLVILSKSLILEIVSTFEGYDVLHELSTLQEMTEDNQETLLRYEKMLEQKIDREIKNDDFDYVNGTFVVNNPSSKLTTNTNFIDYVKNEHIKNTNVNRIILRNLKRNGEEDEYSIFSGVNGY